jgi:hypothetical protein
LKKQYNDGLSLVPVGLALLVMALSLTAIAISFISFGHLTGYVQNYGNTAIKDLDKNMD